MKRLWKYPFDEDQYLPPIFIFGPIVSWYYLLNNDFFFNKGKNAVKIILVHILLLIIYFRFFEFVKLKDYTAKEMIVYFGFNFIFLFVIRSIERFLLGKKMDFYKSQEGKFNNSLFGPLIVIIPLGISIIIARVFLSLYHLLC